MPKRPLEPASASLVANDADRDHDAFEDVIRQQRSPMKNPAKRARRHIPLDALLAHADKAAAEFSLEEAVAHHGTVMEQQKEALRAAEQARAAAKAVCA